MFFSCVIYLLSVGINKTRNTIFGGAKGNSGNNNSRLTINTSSSSSSTVYPLPPMSPMIGREPVPATIQEGDNEDEETGGGGGGDSSRKSSNSKAHGVDAVGPAAANVAMLPVGAIEGVRSIAAAGKSDSNERRKQQKASRHNSGEVVGVGDDVELVSLSSEDERSSNNNDDDNDNAEEDEKSSEEEDRKEKQHSKQRKNTAAAGKSQHSIGNSTYSNSVNCSSSDGRGGKGGGDTTSLLDSMEKGDSGGMQNVACATANAGASVGSTEDNSNSPEGEAEVRYNVHSVIRILAAATCHVHMRLWLLCLYVSTKNLYYPLSLPLFFF
jgi:hypothetical protein